MDAQAFFEYLPAKGEKREDIVTDRATLIHEHYYTLNQENNHILWIVYEDDVSVRISVWAKDSKTTSDPRMNIVGGMIIYDIDDINDDLTLPEIIEHLSEFFPLVETKEPDPSV